MENFLFRCELCSHLPRRASRIGRGRYALTLGLAWLVLLGLLVFRPLAAQANPAETLSLEGAVRSAVSHTHSLAAADAAEQSARHMAVAAQQRPDPVLRLSLDNVPVNGDDRFNLTRDFMTMRSIAFMQMLPHSEKRRARAQRFEREADVAIQQRVQRQAEIQTEVAQTWFERRAQEQRVTVLLAQIDEAKVQLRSTEAAVRGGRGSLSDVLSERDALAQLEQALILAQSDRDNVRRTLARWTGAPAEQPLADPPSIAQLRTELQTPSARLGEALPELAVLRAREAVARAEAEVARQEERTDWSTEFMYSQRGPQYDNMVSVAVSFPLQWDRPQRQQRELAARLARAQELEAEREEMTRTWLLQIERWQAQWRAGLNRLALLSGERQAWAEQRKQAALAAYSGGRVGLGEVLMARRQVLQLQLEHIEIERETARLWAQLSYLIPDADVSPVQTPRTE